jgi:uncharacterized membrane protein
MGTGGTAAGEERPDLLRTTRLEAFSDGVFAIAITLLVLELQAGTDGSALERLWDAWPSYVGYVVSFLTIGAAWLGHNGITDRLAFADALLLRINLLLLLFVVLLPFPTRLVAEALGDAGDERVFVTVYGLTLLSIRVLLHAVDLYSRREHLYRDDVVDDELSSERSKLLPVVVGYLVAIGVGLVLPSLAVAFYFGIAIFLIVPFRKLARLLLGRP